MASSGTPSASTTRTCSEPALALLSLLNELSFLSAVQPLKQVHRKVPLGAPGIQRRGWLTGTRHACALMAYAFEVLASRCAGSPTSRMHLFLRRKHRPGNCSDVLAQALHGQGMHCHCCSYCDSLKTARCCCRESVNVPPRAPSSSSRASTHKRVLSNPCP